LRDGQAEFESFLLDGRERDFHAAPARAIRLSHHKLHIVPGGDEARQRGDRELGSAAENQVHESKESFKFHEKQFQVSSFKFQVQKRLIVDLPT
jgi:hypothetical protein